MNIGKVAAAVVDLVMKIFMAQDPATYGLVDVAILQILLVVLCLQGLLWHHSHLCPPLILFCPDHLCLPGAELIKTQIKNI